MGDQVDITSARSAQAAGAEERVKAQAFALGFSAVGIASTEVLDAETEHLKEWLGRGYHATMGWMARRVAERIDLSRVLSGARSVVAVAMNYYHPVSHPSDRSEGKISRYAWGDDYHEVLGVRLRQLEEWIAAEFPGSRAKAYVDTGPVLEKVWAQRAGIGWIGKHTNVITQELGSWVFLGEVVTTLELKADEPATDHCGSCRLCLDACPTRAIVEPYVLDSRRCISYLTIEHRGELPAEFSDQLEGWIYGCDICQDVCPWNEKFAVACGRREFAPREGMVHPELGAWVEMTDDEFEARFAGSAITRTRAEGLRRNVRAALDARR